MAGAAKMSIRITGCWDQSGSVVVCHYTKSTATGGRNINIDDGNYIEYEQ